MARRILGDEVKIAFHSHDTAGTCVTAYMAAIEAGVDQIDLSLAPVSGGTSQPDVLTMWHALNGTDYELDINVPKIIELEEMFKEAMKDYFLPPESMRVDPLIPFFPMPGGALTANTQMLRDNDLMSRYSEVIAAMGEAVKKGGFGTLGHACQPVLFPAGVQQRHVRPVEKNRRRLRQDGARLFRQNSHPAGCDDCENRDGPTRPASPPSSISTTSKTTLPEVPQPPRPCSRPSICR